MGNGEGVSESEGNGEGVCEESGEGISERERVWQVRVGPSQRKDVTPFPLQN